MRDYDRRLEDLERRQTRRTVSREPIYTVINEGDQRPDIEGPVYVIVSPQPERNDHA